MDKKVSFDKERIISLDGLNYFSEFCNKNNLTYFISYGTLLGAVRHKGFIPWDDDIDVAMPRTDYEKLLKLQREISTDDWELLSYKTNPKYLYFYAKLCHKHTEILPSRFNNGLIYGISIDIFPLDILYAKDTNESLMLLKSLKSKLHNTILSCKPFSIEQTDALHKIKSICKRLFYNMFSRKKKLFDCYSYVEEKINTQSKVGIPFYALVQDFDRDDLFECSLIDGKLTQMVFEKSVFYAPKNYDQLLTLFYGKYMVLPPKSEQVTHHSFICVYK